MATIFSKIVSGEIPCYKVAEDENHLAFFDVKPIAEGHVLVIPKKEIDYLWDMDDKDLSDLMVFSKSVAATLNEHFPCVKVGMAVIGLEVAHAHVHPTRADSRATPSLARSRRSQTFCQCIDSGQPQRLDRR